MSRGNYWLIVALMMTGLYITFASQNLIKRLVGLSVFQTSVFLFYITLSKVAGGTAPILFGQDVAKTEKAEPASGAAPSAVSGLGETPIARGATVSRQPELENDGPLVEGSAPALEGDGAALVQSGAGGQGAETVDNQAGADLYRVADQALYNVYSNPLPHVLILTAIVVGVATLAVGLAIIVRIREAYGTIESDEVRQIDMDTALAEEVEEAALGGAA